MRCVNNGLLLFLPRVYISPALFDEMYYYFRFFHCTHPSTSPRPPHAPWLLYCRALQHIKLYSRNALETTRTPWPQCSDRLRRPTDAETG